MQAECLLKAVADKTRLKILAYLKKGPKFVEQIAMQLNISVSTASFHLEKLKAAGLVCDKKEQYYKTYRLNDGALEVSLGELVDVSSCDEADIFESVVGKELLGERLIKLPVQKMKRDIVLKRIADALRSDKAYTEREINLHVADYCDDFVTARKEMLALGFLEYAGGEYRKTNYEK